MTWLAFTDINKEVFLITKGLAAENEYPVRPTAPMAVKVSLGDVMC